MLYYLAFIAGLIIGAAFGYWRMSRIWEAECRKFIDERLRIDP